MEKFGSVYFVGGEVEGWIVLVLNVSLLVFIVWSEEVFYVYFCYGYLVYYGVVSGLMVLVVGEGLVK